MKCNKSKNVVINSFYHLRSKKTYIYDGGVLEGSSTLDQDHPTLVGKKYNISKVKLYDKKEVREGKQQLIGGALRVGKTPKIVSK